MARTPMEKKCRGTRSDGNPCQIRLIKHNRSGYCSNHHPDRGMKRRTIPGILGIYCGARPSSTMELCRNLATHIIDDDPPRYRCTIHAPPVARPLTMKDRPKVSQ